MRQTWAAPRSWLLLASLPRLAGFEPGAVLPIGYEQLMSRLALLEPSTHAALMDVWQGLDRFEQGAHPTDSALQQDVAGWLLRAPLAARPLLQQRLQAHALVAALRRRRHGLPQPGPGWGWGAQSESLAHPVRWAQPLFGLATAQPWLAVADACLAVGNAIGLSRLLDGQTWAAADRLREQSPFSEAAVYAWCLQWRLAATWSALSPPAARQRLRQWLQLPPATDQSAATPVAQPS